MTDGGPQDATVNAVYYMYEQAFKFQRMGPASATAILVILLLVAITLAQTRLLRTTMSTETDAPARKGLSMTPDHCRGHVSGACAARAERRAGLERQSRRFSRRLHHRAAAAVPARSLARSR